MSPYNTFIALRDLSDGGLCDEKWSVKVHKSTVIKTREYKGRRTTMHSQDILDCKFIGYNHQTAQTLFGGYDVEVID